MEEPTPCQYCSELFELSEGRESKEWFPNTIICKSCSEKEKDEFEDEPDEWETDEG